MSAKEIKNNELHLGQWYFTAPTLAPDADGRMVVAKTIDSSTGEFFEWGLDEDGNPYERHERIENGRPSEDDYIQTITLEKFVDQLGQLKEAVRGTELETWTAQYDAAIKKTSAAEQSQVTLNSEKNPLVDKFVVYNLFKDGTKPIFFTSKTGRDIRLEKYYFSKYMDGTIEFTYQEGWFAGSHYDGGCVMRVLPRAWFELTWNEFLDRLTERFPPSEYYYNKSELNASYGLKEFLGFNKRRTAQPAAEAPLSNEADKITAPKPTQRTRFIVAERDSVSMGDDCLAPHTEKLPYNAEDKISDFMLVVADYLPKMANVIWAARCDKKTIAYLEFDSNCKLCRSTLAIPDMKTSELKKKSIFCKYYYAGMFASETDDGAELSGDAFLEKVKACE